MGVIFLKFRYMDTMDFLFFQVPKCNSGVGVGRFFGIFIFSKSRDVTAVLELGDLGDSYFFNVRRCNSGVGVGRFFFWDFHFYQSPEM